MKPYLTLLLCSLSVFATAQTIPYETLDSFSREISRLQATANEMTCTEDSTDVLLSFGENNFQVLSSDRLATNAVYKKSGGKEVLSITGNIDLSKIVSCRFIHTGGDVAVLRLVFGYDTLITTHFEDGIEKGKLVTNHVDLYVRLGKNAKSVTSQSKTNNWSLYNSIVYLGHMLKAEK